MHAYLFVSKNQSQLVDHVNNLCIENNFRQLPFYLQKIEDSKDLKKLVKFSFSEKTAIVITNIDKATTEAANAFLKNLEEPNKNLTYILTAEKLDGVLPTIISRCEALKIHTDKDGQTENQDVVNFCSMSANEQFVFIDKIKERENAIKFVEDLIEYKYKKLPRESGKITSMLSALKNLKSNGNVSLQLTNLLVTMNRYG